MALGFGFNKVKVMAAAEKYVQQGKLQNAVSEYEKVVKEDPNDLTVLNTIGDLHSRLGNNDKAAHYFKQVGEAYAKNGFTVKAIAMYKKLTKLNPHNSDAVQKLAELYTQQGLYNDARQQYVLLADHWIKSNNLESAALMFQKMLELDPENAAMQTKLADLYIRMGKKDDAKEIYFRAAESLMQRSAADAADEALGRILSIDPSNERALLKRAQIASDSGDAVSACHHLKRLSNVEGNADALGILLRAQIQQNQSAEAEKTARKLATQHNDLTGLAAFADWLIGSGSYDRAVAMYDECSEVLLKNNPTALTKGLESAMGRLKDNVSGLEKILNLFQKLGDRARAAECTDLLAEALAKAGEFRRARDLYGELADHEPDNPVHQQRFKQMQAKLGEDAAVRPLTAEEGAQAFMVDELEMEAPALQQEYPDEIADAIKGALTDSELMNSYNLPVKALGPLEKVLPRAPHDARLNQRLASLYAAAHRFADAVRCCEILESLYRTAGHEQMATQYHEIGAKYRERIPTTVVSAVPERPAPGASSKPAEVAMAAAAAAEAPPEFAVIAAPAPIVEPSATATPPEASAVSNEIDLSDEWESEAATEEAPEVEVVSDEPSAADILDEARFYISQKMWTEAKAACERCAAIAPSSPDLAAIKAQISAAMAPPPEIKVVPLPPSVQAAPKLEPAPAASAGSKNGDLLDDFVSDLESSLGDDFAIAAPSMPPTAAKPAPVAVPVASVATQTVPASQPAAMAAAPVATRVPGAADASSSSGALGWGTSPGGQGWQAAAAQAATVADAPNETDTSSALADMFAEFKSEAEQGEQDTEDPETHYNLGVAFREMGLLDEAIGELQKVCLAIDQGIAFPQTMQAYTWLAQCFVEKGVPEASVKWYDKALKFATQEEQRMALHYDMASAYEAGGNRQAALQHFMEVYGSNIDYRDVAERIKALRS